MQADPVEKTTSVPPFLQGCQPLSWLWDGAAAPYPSECSARWALAAMRETLNREGILAKYRGRLYIDTTRFNQVMREEAIRRAGGVVELSTASAQSEFRPAR